MIVFWDRLSADHCAALQVVAPQLGVAARRDASLRERAYDYARAIAGAASNGSFFARRRIAFLLSGSHAPCGACNPAPDAPGLRTARTRRRRRPDILWAVAHGDVCAYRKVYRSHREGSEDSGAAIEQPTKFELAVNLKTDEGHRDRHSSATTFPSDEVINETSRDYRVNPTSSLLICKSLMLGDSEHGPCRTRMRCCNPRRPARFVEHPGRPSARSPCRRGPVPDVLRTSRARMKNDGRTCDAGQNCSARAGRKGDVYHRPAETEKTSSPARSIQGP